MQDTYKHRGLRKQLVKELAEKGISDAGVLSAIGRVPRHFFFERIFDSHAYEDKAFPIAAGQTISQPYTVAYQSQQLGIKQGDKILEIGTGSGYQSCVLVELGAEVFTIEYQKELFRKAIRFLPSIGYHPHIYHGDGSLGMPKFAPYDGIIVTAGAPGIPRELIQQLKTGGKLVIPVGSPKEQKMNLITKLDEQRVEKSEFSTFSFVPLLGKNGRSFD
ncbi:MAG: protein-L-isoaspartate(D-aspartate) O-methyltransferase [Bacteroidota bacterium]